MNIVWFKRDLRLSDHLPLLEAIKADEPTLLLYIYEPSLINDRHYSIRHWRFVQQSLNVLNEVLIKAGNKIYIFYGNATEVFGYLIKNYPVKNIYSHVETGLKLTYQRDLDLNDLFKNNKIQWFEYNQNGVKRGLKNREGWVKNWYDFMQKEIPHIEVNKVRPVDLTIPEVFQIRKSFQKKLLTLNNEMQRGGFNYARRYLRSFLLKRHQDYNKNISKPNLSFKSCSRLSPYLAWGNISVREVYQYVGSKQNLANKRSISAFKSRLRWHCHFIQKFEMEHEMEWRPINKGYDLLEYDFDQKIYNAWRTGNTGFPMVDASMRSLIRKGYVNFRMRAMLISFLCHLCNQSWENASTWLSKLFLDFEPGIHYPQIQMQAGLTGINTIRIYNPVKQAYENDEKGNFIKEFVPELKDVPVPLLFEPHKLTASEQIMYNCRIGEDYPKPLFELSKAYSAARERLWKLHKSAPVKNDKNRILKKHTVKDRKV
ncbi:cryptochrome/deoxyribodipyrimidine photo-lyase family protein [Mangrovivirga cuniculi]|uniref:Deoxyribodipyrimidine photolyase n=1 Tax=Mangrovivirga cuniculi TaxID=2715131 RepID=A0A4D7JFW8_9BACT|nr:FAD-binding domain-containing protein [Mangrovivirga cuniculi]QCK15079.1 deoxyribodipyrimidine photolyase [Mangrovivirga cuniculi]